MWRLTNPGATLAGRRGRMAAAVIALLWSIAGAAAPEPPPFTGLDAAPLAAVDAPASRAARQAMVEVPAAVYPIGDDDGPADQHPAHTVRLEGFRIDRTEVTNAAFAEFLNALPLALAGDVPAGELAAGDVPEAAEALLREGPEGVGRYPLIALDDAQARIGIRDGGFATEPGYEDHPVTETTWAGARAYCRWRGARLPSEAEWEAAARGTAGRTYPWGEAPPTDERVFVSRRTGVTAAVGSRPAGASPFGALDMAGSLAEWTASLKRPYPYDAEDGREDPRAAGERVTRGGDYIYDTAPEALTTTHRDGFSNAPHRGHRHIGFRCAESRPEKAGSAQGGP